MTESLYLIIERGRRSWCPRISRVSKKRPTLARPSEQALVRLVVEIPYNVMQPREVRIEIKPEHVVQPVVTVRPAPAA